MNPRKKIIFDDILSAFSQGKKYLSISEVAELCGHHRHTVARYLDSLVLSGRLEMREHGQKKKYYVSDLKPESSLLNFSSHILIILNTDLTIRWANETFLRLIDSTSEAVIGLSIDALQLEPLFGPDLIPEIRIVSSGESRSFESVVEREDTARTYLFTISSISFFQDRPALVINGEDITEKRSLMEAIRVNESNLRIITESVRDIIIRWDRDGTISYVSPACGLLTGFVSTEIVGRNISDFINPVDLLTLQKVLHDLVRKGESPPSSFRFRNIREEWVWFETTITSRLNEEEEVIDYISVWRDITDRLEAERKLAHSEEKYRRLFQSAKDAIILMELTDDLTGMRSLEMNNLACEMIQYSQAELLSLDITNVISDDHQSKLIGAISLFIENKQIFFEIDLIRKDGAVLPVEVNAHLFLLQGKTMALAIARDITERKRTESAVKEAFSRLEYILEFLPDPFFVLDTTGTVTAWNRSLEDLTGISRRDILGKNGYAPSLAFYKEKRPVLSDYILSREPWILEYYANPVIEGDIVMADIHTRNPVTGALLWFWVKAAPLYDLHGNVIGAIETMRDITIRKQMEIEISRQNVIFEAISNAGSCILQSDSIQECVSRTIQLIGEASDVSAVCLFENKTLMVSKSSILFRDMWAADPGSPGIMALFSSFHEEEIRTDGILSDVITRGNTQYHLVTELSALDQEIFTLAGVKSVLLVPVSIGSDILGAVGLLECEFERLWSPKEIHAMEIAASLIGNAILRFQARQDLAHSEQQFRTLAQNIPGIVFRLSLTDSEVEFYNDNFLDITGYSVHELASGQFSSLIPLILAEEKEQVIQKKMDAIMTGTPYDITYHIIDKFGRIRLLSERGRPVSDDSGQVVSIDGIIQDISDQPGVLG
ncbi:MAG TPA: PAS domain S-box protein [Methanospirillum sp.]|nr:PAS domain S-box protein [Methanospirillum sp.]